VHGLLSTYPNTPPDIPLRALKYSPNITLSFVLLNEDAAAGSYVRSWDIAGAIKGALGVKSSIAKCAALAAHRSPAPTHTPHTQIQGVAAADAQSTFNPTLTRSRPSST
jgi:hypothetical protein